MNVLLEIPVFLLRTFILMIWDYALLAISLMEAETNFVIDFFLRLILSFFAIPKLHSTIDRILSRLGFMPFFEFFPEYHPRLHGIEAKIREHLQTSNTNHQILDAYRRVLDNMHTAKPGTFSALTNGEIEQRFNQNWPRIRPLPKASCLNVGPINTLWGAMEPGVQPPILWINPHLVQALENAPRVRINEYSLYTSLCTNCRTQIRKCTSGSSP